MYYLYHSLPAAVLSYHLNTSITGYSVYYSYCSYYSYYLYYRYLLWEIPRRSINHDLKFYLMRCILSYHMSPMFLYIRPTNWSLELNLTSTTYWKRWINSNKAKEILDKMIVLKIVSTPSQSKNIIWNWCQTRIYGERRKCRVFIIVTKRQLTSARGQWDTPDQRQV